MYEKWINKFNNPKKKLSSITKNIPLENRMTSVAEIADTVAFLLSQRSSHTTGQIIFVDGGILILIGPFNIIIKMTKNKLKNFCLALDLKDDKKKINAYKLHHKNVWPEIKKSIKESGIKKMEIFLTGNRLFMIIKVDEFFSFEKKRKIGFK